MHVLSTIFLPLLGLWMCSAYRYLGICPLSSWSHFNIFHSLMKGLIDKGHQVDVISQFPQKKPYPNYTDIITVQTSTFINNMTYEFINKVIKSDIVKTVAITHGNELCQIYLRHPVIQKLVRDPPKDPPYDAVIMEIFGSQCFAIIAHILNIPLIGVSTTSMYPWLNRLIAQPENLAFIPNNCLTLKNPMNFWQRMYNVLYTFYANLYFNYLTKTQDDIIRKYFGSNLPSVWKIKPALILINSHIALNEIQPMTPALVQIGGIHVMNRYHDDLPLSAELKKWMDDSKDGFIYFTFGSMVMIETFPRKILDIFYKSLAKIAPVRILMKIPKPEKLPPGLPENIRISSWISQLKILKHPNIKAFITHGGHLSTLEAMIHSIPMIGIPLFADQFENIDSYVDKNVAVKLDITKITEKDMDTALNAILYDSRYRENIKNLSERFLNQLFNPIDIANFWIEYVVKYGKDILWSPALDLAWWQLYLVDVGAFLLLCVMIVIILAIFILRFVMSIINKSNHKLLHLKKTN